LLALHRQCGAAIHLNLGCFYEEHYDSSVRVRSGIDGDVYRHRFDTPQGSVEEIRRWSPASFSWPIVGHMIRRVEDLAVVRHVFEHVDYRPRWDLLAEADRAVGSLGLPLVQCPYTGLGFLMSRYAGVEFSVLLATDEPEEFEYTIATINTAHEKVFRILAEGPSEVLIHSDNLSSDVESPRWLERYSGDYYRRMAHIARQCDKPLVTHLDGRLRGLLGLLPQMGFSGADAVTPAPWGDLAPAECRDEAGPQFVLSGGVPPSSFRADVPLAVFDQQVDAWLALRQRSPALIIAPGDQLPPDGELDRVTRLVQAAARARYN
jgi:hypothetical protein